MTWLVNLFSQGSVAQTILLLSLISIVGLALGRIKIAGVTLGGSMVFFAAIAAGHFAKKFGIETNASMMDFAKNFGLVVFVYSLGLQCGPGFFSSLRKGGVKLVLTSLATVVLGTMLTAILCPLLGLTGPQATGLLYGAVTNTPGLISAQQTVLDVDPSAAPASLDVGAAYAVGYPFSILTILLVMMLLCKMYPESLKKCSGKETDRFTCVKEVHVSCDGVIGKSIRDVVKRSGFHFVISRVWRDGQVQIPVSDTVLMKDDHLLIICDKEDEYRLPGIFGGEENTDWNRPDIEWDTIDKELVSRHVLVTKTDIVGYSLGQLKLRNKYGVNITRLTRAEITLVPSASTVLQLGDRLTVVGEESKISAMAATVGNKETTLNEPRLIPILAGIFLGVLLGSIPFNIPGMSTPLKLGIAGGPIVMGILMGAFGPKFHITTYTTRSANFMLRQMGITFFFASLGFGVGGDFVDTVFCLRGLKWAGIACVLAGVPVLLMGIFNEKVLKMDLSNNLGSLCGSVTNPNALNYVNDRMDNSAPAGAYATVYPIVTFARVFFAQILILVL